MKTFKDYSLKMNEQDYHSHPAWSYSLISRYAKDGFGAIAKLHEPITATPSMAFGSLFDAILTKGKGALSEYAVSDIVPPAAERNVLDTLLTLAKETFVAVNEDDIKKAIEICNYQSKWGYASQYKHISEYADYYETRRTGKKIVSSEEWNDAIEMARTFRNDKFLSELFGTKDTDRYEYVYQSKFIFTTIIDGIEVDIKFMPDLIRIDKEEKTIQPVDLKTSADPAYDFANNFIKYRYDIQASLYTDGIITIQKQMPEYAGYSVLPYLFVDISRSDKVPVTYIYDPLDESQINGLSYGQYTYKNWKTLLSEILAYEKTSAKVPSWISTSQPNDIVELLSYKK